MVGEKTLIVERDQIYQTLADLKKEGFNLLLDICGVDYQDEIPRFEVVYHLYALAIRERVRVRVRIPEADLKIRTVINLWEAADWFEREAYDMYGIIFEGHPNLKRLLMWEKFEGYPLRKDYPLDKRQPIPESLDIV